MDVNIKQINTIQMYNSKLSKYDEKRSTLGSHISNENYQNNLRTNIDTE